MATIQNAEFWRPKLCCIVFMIRNTFPDYPDAFQLGLRNVFIIPQLQRKLAVMYVDRVEG